MLAALYRRASRRRRSSAGGVCEPRSWEPAQALRELLRGRLQASGTDHGSCAGAARWRCRASAIDGALRRSRARASCCAASSRPVAARARVVRAAAAGAHSSLHHQVAARRDRAGGERRLHALPARLAGRDAHAAARGRGESGARHRAAGGFRDRRRSPGRATCCRRGCSDYDGGWLDSLCLSGRAFWARLVPPRQRDGRRRCAPRRSRC